MSTELAIRQPVASKSGTRMYSFFRRSALSASETRKLLAKIQELAPSVTGLETEYRFYIESNDPIQPKEGRMLIWFLREQFEPQFFGQDSLLNKPGATIEVGPRKSLIPPWSSTALLICGNAGVKSIVRIARARRYCLIGCNEDDGVIKRISALLFDRMTEEIYFDPLETFQTNVMAPPAEIIRVLEDGASAIKAFAKKRNLKFDNGLIRYIIREYCRVGYNPTDVELFLIGQLWSNHCRHRDFNARFIIDGAIKRRTPFQLIKATCKGNVGPLKVRFSDNAAILRAKPVLDFAPASATGPSPYVWRVCQRGTASKDETHNHPTAIDPYDGAGTGMAVLRDMFGAGRGGDPKYYIDMVHVGNLFLPTLILPWEKMHLPHPGQLATPLRIAIEGTTGAANHGNCIGIPTIAGSYLTFDDMVDGQHYAYTKPVFVAGVGGWVDARHFYKVAAQKGMLVVLLGGPAYWIGVGGGSGSSQDAGRQSAKLAFDSVQRPDPWTEGKNWNLIRACIEMGLDNPIEVITDLGAGGVDVAVPEICFPAGAKVYLDDIPSGDPSMPEYVLTGNEAQERMVVLVWPENYAKLEEAAQRQRCSIKIIGEVTGDGKYTMVMRGKKKCISMDMGFMLQDLPQLTIRDKTRPRKLLSPVLPNMTIREMLGRTQKLARVAEVGFITSKLDMTVTGNVNRNPIVGKANLPLADCGVVVDSYWETTGQATGIGVQPVKMLVNVKSGVNVTIAEALLNLAAARVDLKNVCFSATWQWALGQPGESASFYQAVEAANAFCRKLIRRIRQRVGVGKDSLSMTVVHETQEVTKAPGTVQFRAFTDCLDVTKTLTPDIKRPGQSRLALIDPSRGLRRLGGSALLQVLNQIGDKSPDVDYPDDLIGTFLAMQELMDRGLVLAYHDRSDGGLVQCFSEMAYAGNCGLRIKLPQSKMPGVTAVEDLFAEEPGVVIEYLPENAQAIKAVIRQFGLSQIFSVIGETVAGTDEDITVIYGNKVVLQDRMINLRQEWRELSFHHDAIQANPETVAAERKNTYHLPEQRFHLSFVPQPTKQVYLRLKQKPAFVIFTEAGTNGHREFAGAVAAAGFEPWSVTMTDWYDGRFALDPEKYRCFGLPGGFADMDVGDAGKGLAMKIRFNERMNDQLHGFVQHQGTLGLCICNGFQGMTRLGILPWVGISDTDQPCLVRNVSDRFESRPVMLRVMESPCVWTAGMAGSVIPAWICHAEGQIKFPNPVIMEQVLEQGLAPIRFADRLGRVTQDYPFNPNGSPLGITSLCSPDGRFLGKMPHSERNFRKPGIQALYTPSEWSDLEASPSLRFYQNAYEWIKKN
ncbi:MAG: phosphoribosylformylglycinamidine synthase [Candidatus Buchananbacteria bacterium]